MQKFYLVLAILFFTFISAPAQKTELFATDAVERRIRKQFHLSSGEMHRLRPLIEREGAKLTVLLARYSDSDNGDFLSLWNALRIDRSQADPKLTKELTARQVNALGAARTSFENEILDKWLEGYVGFLAEVLSMDVYQSELLMRVFESETRQRRPLLARYNAGAWDKLTNERERRLRSILTPEQQRSYDRLFEAGANLIA